MEQYLNLLSKALGGEIQRKERTGVGTIMVVQEQAKFDLAEGFPMVTTKPVSFKNIKYELLWFLQGADNIKWLVDNNVKIWNSDCLRHNMDGVLDSGLMTEDEVLHAQKSAHIDGEYGPGRILLNRFHNAVKDSTDFAKKYGGLGPVYGAQWRGMNGAVSTDQIGLLEKLLQDDPGSRYQIVTAWNPVDKEKQALPACHTFFQSHVLPESNKLSMGYYQRSCDAILGVPYNIASYALLANMIAHVHDLELGVLTATHGDFHIYLPHIDAAKEQIQRTPLPLGKIKFNTKPKSITEFKPEDIELIRDDKRHPPLSYETPMFGGLF